MRAEIITIGDEILIGQVVDTNSAFLASELNKLGVSVHQITSVQDDRSHILKALEEAEARVELILMTGGLGPTKDDITKRTLCEYLGDTLVEDPGVLAQVEHLFKTYLQRPVTQINRQQALVPSRATVLPNRQGTAPGMWMQGKRAVLVSLPGVPFEMKELFRLQVGPKITATFQLPVLLHKTLITYGLGESAIAERLEAWEDALPANMKFAYLPNLGKVRLRLSARGERLETVRSELEGQIHALKALIADILYGEEDGAPLEEGLCTAFTAKGATLATAESVTGGGIASLLCSVPGASAYFKGSVVCYATEVKEQVLGVPRPLIEAHSVVSAEVACAMAEGVRALLKTDFALAATGNAGPTKGDSDAPIGTVYLAVAGPGGTEAFPFTMGGHRERVVQKSVNKALELLWREIGLFTPA